VSPPSIRAYEQGWRPVPSYVEASALYLIYKLQRNESDMPCWKIKECPSAWREQCPTWELKARGPCWFINGAFCEGTFHRTWEEKNGDLSVVQGIGRFASQEGLAVFTLRGRSTEQSRLNGS
jgi:hypothetical protein